MICPQCQAENEEGARFCGNCGAILPEQQIYCPQCGAPNPADSRFCGDCGTGLAPEEPQPVYAVSDQYVVARKKTSWAWWLLPIYLAWVGGLIAWAVVRDDDRSKARGMLILGIVMTVLWFLLWVVIFIIANILAVTTY